MEKLVGLNISFLTTCESWNTKGNYQEWHNTTSNDTVEGIALLIARWRKLELLWKESWWTLLEGIKSLMNHLVEPPWRTPVNKRITKIKRSWKHKVKPCNDLDGSPWWYNWESLEPREEKIKHLEPRMWYDEPLRNAANELTQRNKNNNYIMLIPHQLNWWQTMDLHTTYSRRKD